MLSLILAQLYPKVQVNVNISQHFIRTHFPRWKMIHYKERIWFNNITSCATHPQCCDVENNIKAWLNISLQNKRLCPWRKVSKLYIYKHFTYQWQSCRIPTFTWTDDAFKCTRITHLHYTTPQRLSGTYTIIKITKYYCLN